MPCVCVGWLKLTQWGRWSTVCPVANSRLSLGSTRRVHSSPEHYVTGLPIPIPPASSMLYPYIISSLFISLTVSSHCSTLTPALLVPHYRTTTPDDYSTYVYTCVYVYQTILPVCWPNLSQWSPLKVGRRVSSAVQRVQRCLLF